MTLRNMKKRAQKGFTMIELVIVIAVLGILAAFALPRFANFTNDAKLASANSFQGTINASLGIVKSKYLAQGSSGTTVNLNGQIVDVTNTGDLDMSKITDNATCSALVNKLIYNQTGLITTVETPGKTCFITYSGYIFRLNSNYADIYDIV